MVERNLAKVDTRVRFPSSAPSKTKHIVDVLFLSYPFIRQCRLFITPVFISRTGDQIKSVFYQHPGRGLILCHGAGGDYLDIRFPVQVADECCKGFAGYPLAPVSLDKTVTDADLVYRIAVSVQFRNPSSV